MTRRKAELPASVQARLKGLRQAFPLDWTLEQVAEESHRAFLAKRWEAPVAAVAAVTNWALAKLAAHPGFTTEHWRWIITPSSFGDDGVSTRLAAIVRPATGYSHAWRTSHAERMDMLREMDRLASELLDLMRGNFALRVGLREVVGTFPQLQPLLDESARLGEQRRAEIQAKVRKGELGGPEAMVTMARGQLNPTLEDYLDSLRAKLAGKLRPAAPSISVYALPEEVGGVQEVEADGSADDDSPDDVVSEAEEEAAWQAVAGRFGLGDQPMDPANLLNPGGSFGSYPSRKSSLRRAVIAAVPNAVLDRDEAEPSVTLASFIEEACMAWFGNSPTAKEINAMIKDQRQAIQSEQHARTAERQQFAEIEAKAIEKLRESGGLSDPLRKFLELD